MPRKQRKNLGVHFFCHTLYWQMLSLVSWSEFQVAARLVEKGVGHGRRQRSKRGAAAALLPLPALALVSSLPWLPIRKNFDGDNVLSGNHTHSKVWLIKHDFCKMTRVSVIFLHFQILKRCTFAASIACPKAKNVSASGGLCSLNPYQGLCLQTPLHPFDAHNNWIRLTFSLHTHKIYRLLCPSPCPTWPPPPQLQIPSVVHGVGVSYPGPCNLWGPRHQSKIKIHQNVPL